MFVYNNFNSISSTTSSASNSNILLLVKKRPRFSLNKTGNRMYIDFGGVAKDWIYGESDVEIGLTGDLKISYVSIEFKKKLNEDEQVDLREAVENETI